MTKLSVYTIKGVRTKGIDLPKRWREKVNMVLLAQAIRVYEDRRHTGLSKVKTRGEVSYSTRKIYRQKGTGLARHGDRGAPIFVKGGVAHGPIGVKRQLSLPKKMGKKALSVALTLKAQQGRLLVVNGISKLKKTKEAVGLIDKIADKEKEIGKDARFTFALSDKNKDARLALRNIETVEVLPFNTLNAHKVYFGGVLVVDKEALDEQRNLPSRQAGEKAEKLKRSKSGTLKSSARVRTAKRVGGSSKKVAKLKVAKRREVPKTKRGKNKKTVKSEQKSA